MSSIIIGILASVLPNLLFYWLYRLSKARTPLWFVRFLYINEGLKFAALALLVSAFLLWPNLQKVNFFMAFLFSELARLLWQFFQLSRTNIK